MILVFHLIIAFVSVIFSTYLFFYPSKTKIYIAYGLIMLTLGSGTYMLWSLKTHILQGCVTGLAYSFGAIAAVVLANRKLAAESTKK